jgi:hypothetical protein
VHKIPDHTLVQGSPTPQFAEFHHHLPLVLEYSSFSATIWFAGTAADATAASAVATTKRRNIATVRLSHSAEASDALNHQDAAKL